jgi:uncharacterized protein YndB with AHSA1/START domain
MSETEADAATETLVVERELPHPPEKIWRALTSAALVADWLMPNDFAAEPGRRFQFRAQPMPHWDGVVDGEVLAVEPPSRLSYRWDTGADPAHGLRTIVTFTLTPTAGGTMVRMEQAGFRPGEEDNLRGARFGWERMLGGLERVTVTLGEQGAGT